MKANKSVITDQGIKRNRPTIHISAAESDLYLTNSDTRSRQSKAAGLLQKKNSETAFHKETKTAVSVCYDISSHLPIQQTAAEGY